ncbi:MAG: PQQ-binding-like beta-propeller repeat protein [Halobaculum sp.]
MTERTPGRRTVLAGLGAVVAGCGGQATETARDEPTDGTTDDTTDAGTGAAGTTAGSGETTANPADISLPEGAAWPSFGGTSGNRGSMDTGRGPSAPAGVAWRTDVDGTYTMPGPAVADGMAFVGSGTKAYAFDARTGETAWTAELEVLTHHFSPTVADGAVVFAAQPSGTIQPGSQGRLARFAFDGREAWRRTLPVTTDPTLADGRIVVGESATDGGAVRAVDPADGTDLWRTTLDASGVRGAPAVVDGLAVVTAVRDETGLLAGLDPASGSVRFTVSLPTGARAAPVVADGTVFVQRNDGVLAAFGLDGSRKWRVNAGKRAGSAPVVVGDRVVAFVENTLVGIDRSGETAWTADIGTTLINGVTVAGDTAYVGGSRLSAVSVADGSVVWDVPIPGEAGAFGAPVVVGNTAFVGVCIKREAGDLYDDYMYAFV